jgi:hypothetical protein
MGLLDWIRNRNRPEPVCGELDPRAHGHASWKEVFAEIRADEALAKQRNETGREPECRNPKSNVRRGPSVER